MSQFKVGDKVRVLPGFFDNHTWDNQVAELVSLNYYWNAFWMSPKGEEVIICLKENEMELVSRPSKQTSKKDIKRIKDWLELSFCAGDLSLKIAAADLRTIYNALDELYALRAENED